MTNVVRCDKTSGLTLKWGAGRHVTQKHAHANDSLSIVLSGTTEVAVGFETISLREGQFIWIPAGLAHVCRPIDPESFAFAVLYVVPNHPRFQSTHGYAGTVGSIDLTWFEDLASFRPGADADAVVRRIAAHCGERVLQGDRISIRAPHPIPLDGDNLLEEAGSTGTPVRRDRFRHYRSSQARYSLGPKGVRQVQRIEAAIRLLGEGYSVADVAARCGCCDQSHLVKMFRSYTGSAPSAYRESR